MRVIGLTGSIGMGKTTVAGHFAELGIPICSADAIVHALLEKDGALIDEVARHFPDAVKNGTVDRATLGNIVFHDAAKRKQLEALLHPRVVAEENRFIEQARQSGAPLAVLEIPLLFETGAEKRCDVTMVASAPAFLQWRRVQKRPGMTRDKFRQIIAAQMPDAEKRRRADFIVQTGLGRAYSFRQVKQILKQLDARDRS